MIVGIIGIKILDSVFVRWVIGFIFFLGILFDVVEFSLVILISFENLLYILFIMLVLKII